MKSDVSTPMPTTNELLLSVEKLRQNLSTVALDSEDQVRARYQLQTALQGLLLADLETALDHKVEQELWNACFKSQITLMQPKAKDKKLGGEQKEWQAMLYLFLDAALGFYTLLLNQLCEKYDIDLPFRRKDPMLWGMFDVDKEKRASGGGAAAASATGPAPKPAASRSSCFYVIQDCLVHMGDVARYRGKVKQAESCYRHAANLLPSSGQPYNQLALLEAQHGDGISAVYYYVRSVAVRQPFPAATTNLAKLYTRLTSNGSAPDLNTRLTAGGYTAAFLQLHAQLSQQLARAGGIGQQQRLTRQLLKALTSQLLRQLVADSLSTWRLLQMLAISVQATHGCVGRPDGGGALEVPASCGASERLAYDSCLQLVAATLEALLKTTYRLPTAEARRASSLLPVVRLYVCWLAELPAALASEAFSTRPQLWAHLCHLVNGLELTPEMLNNAAESRLPLPEDCDLAGFLPLSGCQRALKLGRPPPAAAERPVLRAARLRAACERLARHGVVWSSGGAGAPLQSAYSVQEEQVLRELKQAETRESPSTPSAAVDMSASAGPTGATSGGGESPLPTSSGAAGTAASTDAAPVLSRTDSKTGILKTTESAGSGRRRQNVALQAIFKSGGGTTSFGSGPENSAFSSSAANSAAADETQSRDSRQVKFRIPSPVESPSPPALASPTTPPSQQQYQTLQPHTGPPSQTLSAPAPLLQPAGGAISRDPSHVPPRLQPSMQQRPLRCGQGGAGGDTWRQAQQAQLQTAAAAAWPPQRPMHPLDDQLSTAGLMSRQQGQSQNLQFNPLVPPPGWGGPAAPVPAAQQQQQQQQQLWPTGPQAAAVGRSTVQAAAAAAAAGMQGMSGPQARASPGRGVVGSPYNLLRQPLWPGWQGAAAASAAVGHRQANPLAAILSQCRAPAHQPPLQQPAAAAARQPAPAREPVQPSRGRDGLGVYSLFPSAPQPELTARGAAYSLFPSSNVQQQSMWPSAGPSPLERLIEQQRQRSGGNPS